MEFLLDWDRELFVFLHQGIENSFFNWLLPVVRNRYIWIPFYIFIISYVVSSFSSLKAYYYLIFIIFSVVITDQVSGKWLKYAVERNRPCHDTELVDVVTPRVHCRYSFSFPSSHATNHFGLAMILSFLLFRNKLKWKVGLFGWASLISIAQVYVGLHYPSDIIVGAILGITLIQLFIVAINPIVKRFEDHSV